ncbi:MAG: tetratricopeptide repeat protein [Bacteroidales bacterium]|nr:tetratricopeptide repeat protein [Bacteroidales bacterium]
MNEGKNKISDELDQIISLILGRRLKEAIDRVKSLAGESGREEYVSQVESLDATYGNLLKYAMEDVEDLSRDQIFSKLQLSLLELADQAGHQILKKSGTGYPFRMKRILDKEVKQPNEVAQEALTGIQFRADISEIMPGESGRVLGSAPEDLEVIRRIFDLVWLADQFSEADTHLFRSVLDSGNIPWHQKCVVVSALTLSLIRYFHPGKVELLIHYGSDVSEQIRCRSLTGLLLSLIIHDRRLILYPELNRKLAAYTEIPGNRESFRMIALQMLKSKETEKISRRLDEEILPEVEKIQPRLRDKLDPDTLFPVDPDADRNPDWEVVFEDSPELLDKLQDLSRMQLEGTDVFLSAFSRLKHFDFFDEMVNWFMPFYPDHPSVTRAMQHEQDEIDTALFTDGLARSFYMCNSDKYSFCLNIGYLPPRQKKIMLDMFNAEVEQLAELAREDEMLNQSAISRNIISQYVQDLYRFFKLFSYHQDFTDPFAKPFSFHRFNSFRIIIPDRDFYRNMAEFYFKREYWRDSQDVFHWLAGEGEADFELFEKMGYTFEKLDLYKDAVTWYLKAELFDANRFWILQKLGLCYRKIKDYRESIAWFVEADKLVPGNIRVMTHIGHCHFDLGEYDEALNWYFRAEVREPENRKIHRLIAWSLLLTGRFDEAKAYYKRLVDDTPDQFDLMNAGHVFWCLGDRKEAIRHYRGSIHHPGNDVERFMTGFRNDSGMLESHGIPLTELNFMADYLKYATG